MITWRSEAEGSSHVEMDSSDDLARAIFSDDMGRDEDRPELIAARPGCMNERRQWLAPVAGGVHI